MEVKEWDLSDKGQLQLFLKDLIAMLGKHSASLQRLTELQQRLNESQLHLLEGQQQLLLLHNEWRQAQQEILDVQRTLSEALEALASRMGRIEERHEELDSFTANTVHLILEEIKAMGKRVSALEVASGKTPTRNFEA